MACTIVCLVFCRAWRRFPAGDFFALWLGQEPEEPEALTAVLYESGTLMRSYLQHVRAPQQALLGDIDCFCLPDEVKHQACAGLLVGRPEWEDMAVFLGESDWLHLAVAAPLSSALQPSASSAAVRC